LELALEPLCVAAAHDSRLLIIIPFADMVQMLGILDNVGLLYPSRLQLAINVAKLTNLNLVRLNRSSTLLPWGVASGRGSAR